MPAAICCDLNRNPDECAFLKVAMAKLGWADLGQIAHGEGTSPPTYYHYGAAHEGMQGHGCSRIDLILVNPIALAAFQSYEQIYGCGIAKHSFISATFNLPAFGAMVTMPKTPASIMPLDRYELPEAVNEELVQFAISPNERKVFHQNLLDGKFEEAYSAWNKAAENLLALQTKKQQLPAKCKGKGKAPTFRTQPLAAVGTRLVESGAATEWRLRLCKLTRRCLELEARIKRSMQVALILGHAQFALAKALTAQIMTSGAQLIPDWEHREYPIHLLPPLKQVQTWLQSCRNHEKQDDTANIASRREATKARSGKIGSSRKAFFSRKLLVKTPAQLGT